MPRPLVAAPRPAAARRLAGTALLGLALVAPAAAEAGLSRNGMSVSGEAASFEVFPGRAAGGSDVFCAAGDFARRHLDARATDRVEIVHPIGPSRTRPGQRSVVFAMRPPGSGRNAGLDAVVLRPWSEGVSRSVAFSEALCDAVNRRREDDD
ncbi:hypothetical protein DLJ49_19345 [Rhodovulum sp. 12E13]|uniref:hypothetical protein n=1 Tax=Rhodovulum sp. 12E13 TaxID=2203891 RepID=UPI000E1931CC|nr:hypothetical protein [Rhodovulum sp. 12E13]RDC68956.1 hypothetical protein DLJ49_19345 [Rhodovulum sp. 12E13]